MILSPPPPASIPIPAATLVIFRERQDAAPELLMVERAKAMAFAAGAMVFPGGRVDPGDRALALTAGDDPDDAAARIAAIRETVEEAGLAIGLDPPPAPHALTRLRTGLHAGRSFAELLAETGTILAPAALVPFARWLPAHAPARIFDTRFYLARLPEGMAPASVDRTENVRLVWTTAADMLAEADAGRAAIIYPTRRNLERLARFASFAEAVADADAHPVRTITPFVEQRDGGRAPRHPRRPRLPGHVRADARRDPRLMRALRRIAGTLVIGGTLLALLFVGWAAMRGRPQDLPWTPLDIGQPIGLFTGRKLTALTDDFPACRTALTRAGVAYTALPPRAGEGQCGYADGVRFTEGGSRRIAFSPAGLGVACPVAAALAMWEWGRGPARRRAVFRSPRHANRSFRQLQLSPHLRSRCRQLERACHRRRGRHRRFPPGGW